MRIRNFIVIFLAFATPAFAANFKPVTIGTPSVGSVMYTQGVALSRLLQAHSSVPSSVESVGGSYANMFSLGAGKIDLAISNVLSPYEAYHALPPFKKRIDLRLTAQGQESLRFIIVRPGAGIEKFEDLVGRPFVAKRPSNQELWAITQALLKVHGISEGKMNIITTTNTNETLEALQVGSIDAALVPMARGAATLNKLMRAGQAKILDIPEDKVEQVLALLPKAFRKSTLQTGAFENQNEPRTVLALRASLIAAASLPDNVVYEITKTVFENQKDLISYHASFRQWTLEQTLQAPPLPYHPGAIRYFKEKGVWSEAMDKVQESVTVQ